jgi:hypothetical protein
MSEASVASPQNLTMSKGNSVTSFIEKNKKWIIGGVVLLIVLFFMYRTFFKKKERFNGDGDNTIALEDSEQFTPDGVEENESVNGTEEN